MSRYHVCGVVLATRCAACVTRGLDVADVAHDAITVDLVVQGRDADVASATAAWIATADGQYTTWCWQVVPTIEAAVLEDHASWMAIRTAVLARLQEINPNHPWLKEETP